MLPNGRQVRKLHRRQVVMLTSGRQVVMISIGRQVGKLYMEDKWSCCYIGRQLA